MKNFNEFTKAVKETIIAFMGDEYANANAEVKIVKKNNQLLTGLLVKKPQQECVPTIYLESFYELYKKEENMVPVIEKIAELIKKSEVPDLDVNKLLSEETVRAGLLPRLVGLHQEGSFLEDKIYSVFAEDLAVIYAINFSMMEANDASIVVTKDILSKIQMSKDTLHQIAMENLKKLKPSIRGIGEVIEQIMMQREEEADLGIPEPPMGVISFKNYAYGAAALLLPELLEEARVKYGDEFFIIPSSTKEILVLNKNECPGAEQLLEMVTEVNDNEVAPDEVLSYSVYQYTGTVNRVVSRAAA